MGTGGSCSPDSGGSYAAHSPACGSSQEHGIAHRDCLADNHDHGHSHAYQELDSTCNQDGECCDSDSCCDDETETCADSALAGVRRSGVEEYCDGECIVAAAALECGEACQTSNHDHGQNGPASHEHQHDPEGGHQSSACGTHLVKAHDQYGAHLKPACCSRRTVLERGLATTCCAGQRKNCSVFATSAQSTDPDRTDTYFTGRKKHQHHRPHHHHEIRRRGQRVRREGVMCCGSDKEERCSDHQVEHFAHEARNTLCGSRLPTWDVEKAPFQEHVVVTVDGMTCSGCGNKLERTLKAIAGVSSVRINFVMGHAEFGVDTTVNTADKIFRTVETATNFRCHRVETDDQVLDVLASGTAAKALMNTMVPGVTGAAILNSKTVRLTYNPTVIGARTLLETVHNLHTGLAPPRDDLSTSSDRKRLCNQLVKFMLSATLTIPVVTLAWRDKLVSEQTRSIVCFVLATAVQLIAVPDFYRPALGALLHSSTVEMDMLVVISITAAYTYSAAAFGYRMADHPLQTSEFFETSTLLITLVILGRLVAAFARIRAVKAVSLRSLQATTALIVENGIDIEIDARLLQYGDTLKIYPHSSIATDSIVLSGSSEVDESMLTGESVPVLKKVGDAIIAGTVNGTGTLIAKLTRLPDENTVTDIAKLVEDAQKSKPRLQDYADKVASWFVPVVTSVAVLVVIVWLIIGFKFKDYSTGQAIANATTYAVATLAVACPCALGLAVPMVLVIAGGVAARHGVIIKSAECAERARKVTDVVFDKTGTIVEGKLDVTEIICLINTHEAISISKALVAGNKHPVSLAVARHLAQYASRAAIIDEKHVIPGAGVEAKRGEATLRAGNPNWTGTVSHDIVGRLQDGGMTIMVVTRDREPLAIYGLRTKLREEASWVICQLNRRKIAVHLVSGDQQRAVELAATQVGIPQAASQCTPSGKRDYVANLQAQGKTVMFVGDGTNDAVAVALADVGVQLGSVVSASDVTRGAADVVLLNGLEGIPFLIKLSAVSFRRMVFNFVWSAVYNVAVIAMASGVLVKVRIPPAYAGLGEIVSVVPVIAAATTMLLRRMKIAPDVA